jgi:hypothetical protein
MTLPAKVFLIDPEPRRQAALQFAIARAAALGAPLQLASVGVSLAALPAVEPASADDGVAPTVGVVAASLRAELRGFRAVGAATPVLMLAPALAQVPSEEAALDLHRAAHARAMADGASEVLFGPGYLRDVVLVTRLLASPGERVGQYVGTLGTFGPVLSLLRALSALGRSGVLVIRRGFRSGEVRFCDGELTAVQAGGHHGQAALHQLLLWSDGRFDFRREDVVRRRQIPLPPDELFADAERFLAGIRDASSGLAPVSVLELDAGVAQANAAKIPDAVQGVLRLFDGNRALGDILEDSPYRAFETLRVVGRARDLGLLRPAATPTKSPAWKPMLDVERWMVGEHAAAPIAPAAPSASKPVAKGKAARRKTPNPRAPVGLDGEIDWGVLAPRVVGAELVGLAGVVPAAVMTGEIVVGDTAPSAAPSVAASRRTEREGLEALTDAAARDAVFAPTVARTATPSVAAIAQAAAVAQAAAAPPAPAVSIAPAEPAEPAAASAPPSDLTEPVPMFSPTEISGEISSSPKPGKARASTENPVAASGEIAPRARPTTTAPREPSDQPAILVADLAVAHARLDAEADKLPTPASAEAPTAPVAPPREAPAIVAAVEATRADAARAGFTDDEERFFESGSTKTVPVPKQEVFRDLDQDYQPVGFWERLRGKKPTRAGD